MCGICGFTWDDQNLIRIMGDKIKHRGPEQEGFYIDEHVSLCCERLKILDLSETAKQPQHNEDSSIWVVLNGEIYNFRELRKKLETNHKFYTNSDTEVILHAYEEYGEDCLNHLNGMFAFAIWDIKKKKLFLARDRLGVKPLFYCNVNGNLLFSSEIKSILQLEEIDRKLNYNVLSQFLTYAYSIDGQTLLQNIFELLPGHKLVYSLEDKEFNISNYWELSLQQSYDSEDTIVKKLEKHLEKSIQLRLESDVPIGALLSGGLDSSLMVAMLSKMTNEPVKTFTTGFGHELDEYREAKIVAEHCNTNHQEIELSYKKLANSLPKILWHMEFPFGRPSILSNFLVAEQVKKYVTVAYTGEGADELFGGYNRYLIYTNTNKMSLNEKINSIPSGFFPTQLDRKNFFSSKLTESPSNETNPTVAFSKILEENQNHDLLNQVLLFELKTEIPGAQTWRIDRAGSAHALELREPFLDYELVEYSSSIPAKYKIRFNDEIQKKYILQKLAQKYLPEEIVKRKKFPWGIPYYDFFINEFLPLAECVLDKAIKLDRPFLNSQTNYIKDTFSKVSKIEDKNITNKNVEINDRVLRQIMFLFNLELWYQIFIENDDLKNPNLSLNKFI
ncbi:asparagine synthase (glutamine-hydrolyzing) [Marine Group I thaumarchaeote]|uniref:Putative asparagine synthetase [glutamine-hydrolyzing] n=1 Tax=Marine Group I thaumarchaeote TaxID=2511932 RepID=A0A7K4MM72_9ARCH|nr:asparagine synthase (glutamine-hydrolyzing) [Marine Group I thaumarchaeote]